MFTEEKNQQNEVPQYPLKQDQFDAEQNLVGFFLQLLEIDKRTSPERYTREEIQKHA